MHSLLTTLILALLILVAHPLRAETLLIYYSGNLDGELEPCGCTLETDFGGLSRRATFLDAERQAHPDLIAIDSGGMFSAEMGSDRIRHAYVMKGFARLDYDAIGVQWADLTHGTDFLTGEGLPLVASNWRDDTFARSCLIERGGLRLRYFQWLDAGNSPYKATPQLLPTTDDPTVLAKALRKARKAGELTLLGTSLDLETARARLPLELVDILILKSNYEQFDEPKKLGNTLVLTPGSRGQRIGILTAEVENGRISRWQHRVAELPNTVADSPRMADWYQAYNDALRAEYEERVAARRKLAEQGSPYLGAEQCAGCHEAQHKVWEQTDHARAFTDLEEVGKSFDGHCVGCHVVGYNQPGGFLDISLTEQLAGVQCENCHGGGREHAESGGRTPPPRTGTAARAACASCHVKEHSPGFDFDQYWPKIAHPR